MKLLKVINELHSRELNGVVIEDYNIDYDSITLKNYKNNISTYECSNYEIDGWFRINNTEDDAITFKANLSVIFDTYYEDNRMQFTHGSETGEHDFGSGRIVEIIDIKANSIDYTDNLGHYSQQIPNDLISSFGNEIKVKTAIDKACVKFIKNKSDELIKNIDD